MTKASKLEKQIGKLKGNSDRRKKERKKKRISIRLKITRFVSFLWVAFKAEIHFPHLPRCIKWRWNCARKCAHRRCSRSLLHACINVGRYLGTLMSFEEDETIEKRWKITRMRTTSLFFNFMFINYCIRPHATQVIACTISSSSLLSFSRTYRVPFGFTREPFEPEHF